MKKKLKRIRHYFEIIFFLLILSEKNYVFFLFCYLVKIYEFFFCYFAYFNLTCLLDDESILLNLFIKLKYNF